MYYTYMYCFLKWFCVPYVHACYMLHVLLLYDGCLLVEGTRYTRLDSLQLVWHIVPVVISITLVFRCRRWFWTHRIHHPSTFMFFPSDWTKPTAKRITAPAHVPIVVPTWSVAT